MKTEEPRSQAEVEAATADFFKPPEELSPELLDRSTLDRYATCQLAGWAVETGKVLGAGKAADSGSEAHDVIAGGVAEYAAHGIPPREHIKAASLMTRPDVQPDVIDALKRAAWWIDNYLTSMHPNDLILFQGGEGNRSGQLAREILPATKEHGAIIGTSEVDLVVAGPTPVELFETDNKSGRTVWSTIDIKNSFQFGFHNWLIFGNFPDLQVLHTRVFMTRFGVATPWFRFTRKDAEQFEGRLLMAVKARSDAMKLAAEGKEDQIECWCDADSILSCPAVHLSKRLKEPQADLAKNPAQFAEDTWVMENVLHNRKKSLRQWVAEHGEITGGKIGFGLNAPKTPRKPTANQYIFYTPVEPDVIGQAVSGDPQTEGEAVKEELGELFEHSKES